MGFVNYKNGNYVVYFNLKNGDKIRNTNDQEFRPAFAENCDLTITNKCDGGCPFCYAGCSVDGKHGNLNAEFLNTLHPYTELAINGNDLSHPDLITFLQKMKSKRVIVNMTVNQKHFEQHFDMIQTLQNEKLINGLGVSINNASESLIKMLLKSKNTVLHVINGIFKAEDASQLIGHGFSILILGYKDTCRGQNYFINHQQDVRAKQDWLHSNMQTIFDGFDVVEFDNLALEQLHIKEMVTPEKWAAHYMGDDGKYTFFINLVDGYFAKNSTSGIHYQLMNSIDEMFRFLQEAGDN